MPIGPGIALENAVALQGVPIITTPPTDGQALVYVGSDSKWEPGAGGGGGTNAIGLNTAGTNITWTANSSGLSINAAGYAGTGFSGTNASATLNSNGLQLSVGSPGGAGVTISSFANLPYISQANNTTTFSNSTSVAVSFLLPQAGSFSFLRVFAYQGTNSTTLASTLASMNASAECYTTLNAVVYSIGTGANSRSLQSVASGSAGITMQNSASFGIDGVSGSYTQQFFYPVEGNQSSFTTQYSVISSTRPFSTNTIFTNFSSNRWIDIPFANSLSPGPYWLVVGMTSSSAANSTAISAATNCRLFIQSFGGVVMQANVVGVMGATNQTSGALYGGGAVTLVGGGTTASLPMSNLSTAAGNLNLYFQMIRIA